MKYDVLADYKTFLLGLGLSRETVRTYYNRLDILLKEQNIARIDIEKILDELKEVKYKNYFSQYKNALLYFLEFQNIVLDARSINKIEELEQNTRKKYRKLKESDFRVIKNKINHLKNKKLKLSYQVLSATGLRVSELAQIGKESCLVEEDTITLSFIAKGSNKEEVVLKREDNEKLFCDLQKLIESTASNKKLFYSANYLQQKAKQYGFTCHDLRRACAKVEYKRTKSKNKVKEKLRHKSIKTTNLYLNSKIKI